ncbi:uncharacterized protein LOC125229790 [Leguminivora glycinivorella]|uniref:uncharacterized protein LOC125229790 n=1 Tax=Leguminivora glycinivorella TaxID=1035111 RepID=UPI00200D4893|nr:uncharacterized protein LOC125229790 [Leguminivora glycinivorella]
MKFLALFAVLALASAELSLTEWRSDYDWFPRMAIAPLAAKTVPLTYARIAPLTAKTMPLPYAPMYYKMAPKAYTIPKGYRATYDPENFNEVYGFYPDYKK